MPPPGSGARSRRGALHADRARGRVAHHELQIVTPPGNPDGITGFADLAQAFTDLATGPDGQAELGEAGSAAGS